MALPDVLAKYLGVVQAKIDELFASKTIIGEDGVRGTYYRNIFNGFIEKLDATGLGPHVEGDFPTPSPLLPNNDNVYIHFKLPYNKNIDSKMFWIKITGYAFDMGEQIETTAVGYCYKPTGLLMNTNIVSKQPGELYLDTNGNVVLSLLFSSVYYLTLEIDSMVVGNGTPIKRGMLDVKYSKSNRVVF